MRKTENDYGMPPHRNYFVSLIDSILPKVSNLHVQVLHKSLDRFSVHAWKGISAITVKSPYLNERMPVGDRFSRICQHFIPVISAEGVCIVADATHTNDLIMANTVGAGGREKKEMWLQPLHLKSNVALYPKWGRKERKNSRFSQAINVKE